MASQLTTDRQEVGIINSSSQATSSRFALALALLVLAGCETQQTTLMPSRNWVQAQARVVSHSVSAGGHSYVVDEIYSPSESNLEGIAPGPNDHIWFTGDTLVGQSSIASDMTEFLLPVYGNVTSIVEGPDKNLWTTLYPAAIGRMGSNGHLTAFTLDRKLGIPSSITNGPTRALWFIANGSPNRIVSTTVTGEMKAYGVPAGSALQWLTLGSDGNLWFTDGARNRIGRMTPTGAIKEFSVPTPDAGVSGICQGPDETLWFVEQNANKVASVTLGGSFHEYNIPTPSSGPAAIVAGPDGALWFTEESVGRIGRITTSGSVIELKLFAEYARPYDITVGSDKNVWFTESQSSGIMGRVELHEVPHSQPVYSTITLSFGKRRPQLGVAEQLPLSISVQNLAHHVIKGHYPNRVHLTSTDPKQATLSQESVDSSGVAVKVSYSGHYTSAVISANADGGGRVSPATILPSAPRDKKLPAPGFGLTPGPNDTLWICLRDGKIASYAEDGTVHSYRATTSFKEESCSILEGPDGNVWFTDYSNDRIGKISPQGHVTFYPLGDNASPYSMALGSDGALWFTEFLTSKIGRLTTDGQLKTYSAPQTPFDIVAGPDGNLWYNDEAGDIVRVTTGGKFRPVHHLYELSDLWVGFGNLWFYGPQSRLLYEMSTTGKILNQYSVPDNCLPFTVAFGPKKSAWFVDPGNDCLARMTATGTFIVVPTYSQRSNPGLFADIVVGPRGDLWFTESGMRGLGWVDPRTM
jgi:streptogramin lyase